MFSIKQTFYIMKSKNNVKIKALSLEKKRNSKYFAMKIVISVLALNEDLCTHVLILKHSVDV